ncbi:Zinc-binding dehydrogenase [Sphingobium sp. AP50]|nr:Zinc-binding dehydrogenase [Sphingobium sp. AP50]
MPKEIGLAGLAPLGCGILTGAGAILNALKVTAGASVAIIGAGAVGLSAVMACVLVGATSIVVVDRITDRLMLAAEFGATGTIDTSSVALEEAFDAVKASGFDYVLDTSGVPFLIETAIRALAIRGKLGLVAPGPDFTMPVMSLIGGGREVRGIIEGDADPAELLPRLLAWHREGIFPFDRMIRFYPFDKINEAIADAVAGTVIKPVLRFDDYSAL